MALLFYTVYSKLLYLNPESKLCKSRLIIKEGIVGIKLQEGNSVQIKG